MKSKEKINDVRAILAIVIAIGAVLISTASLVLTVGNKPKPSEKPEPTAGMVRYDEEEGQFQYWGRISWVEHDTWVAWDSSFCPDWQCVDYKLKEKITDNLQKEVNSLQKQLNCLESGGHKWEFVEKAHRGWMSLAENNWVLEYTEPQKYTFKCSKCGKEVKKTEDELTADEREALIKLGIISK